MSGGIFVTATGTDVGKTYVSGLLVRLLRKNGLDAGYYKPALSGGERGESGLIPGDAAEVCRMSGLGEKPETLVSYCFEHAVSPHLAANLEGPLIELPVIQRDYEATRRQHDLLVVEGCGGVICPLRDGESPIMLIDVIRLTGLNVLVVAPSGLGSINGAVLTVEYLRGQGVPVAGILLNQYDPASPMHQDNRSQMERLTGVPVLACVQTGDCDLALAPERLLHAMKLS